MKWKKKKVIHFILFLYSLRALKIRGKGDFKGYIHRNWSCYGYRINDSSRKLPLDVNVKSSARHVY
jgi:hypothetical protein